MTTAGSGVQAVKSLTSPPPAERAVEVAWEAVEQLRGKFTGGAATPEKRKKELKVELDTALGKWHDALCHNVIAMMQKFLKRSKERGAGDCVSSLVSEARKELQQAVKAFKVNGGGVMPEDKGVVSRYSDGVREIDVDRGWNEFFESGASCAKPMLMTVEAAMGKECEGYVTCTACGIALNAGSKERHLAKCGKLKPEQRSAGGAFKKMTAEWAVKQVEGATEPYLRLYTLESPLCYGVNAAMREVAFRGQRQSYEPMKDFAYSLHRAMMSQPKYEGTVFRAMDFRVSESLYSVGAVVTMPHPTSASENPEVVKDFLGTQGDDNEVQGTILVLRVLTGRSIARFSRFPEEKEVLIAANTQFRVVGRPDVGVMRLLEVALDTSMRRVVVVELQEIDFNHWGRLADVMTQVERVRNAKLLDTIKKKLTVESRFELHPVTREGRFVSFPLSTGMPVVDGKTLLQEAAELEHNEQVVSLCCANLAPTGHSEALNASLAAVLRLNKEGSHDNSAAVLLSKGADLTGVPKELHTVSVGLIACACKRAVFDKVMHTLGNTFWGANKEEGPRKGWTVLHAAAARNRADLLKKDVLLCGKLSVDTADVYGNTVCSVAAEHDSADALRILIKEGKADVNKASNSGITPCYKASQNGHTDALRVLIKEGKADVNKGNKNSCTPCYIAAQNGHADILHDLIKEGKADVNKPITNGSTPCLMAAETGHTDSLRVLILEGKANVDTANKGGATPCLMAAQNGHTNALRILINEGKADVNKAKNDKATPCFKAAQNGHADALRIIITEGKADVNAANDNNTTPCFMAAQNGHADALRILITEGKADINKPITNGSTPCLVAAETGRSNALRVIIKEGKADVNKANDKGSTPCYMAAQNGHANALRILITEKKADVDAANNNGSTPCFIAAQNGHANVLHSLIKEGKADVNKGNNSDATPCYMAAQNGNPDALRVLIKEGKADVNKVTKNGCTPCYIAAENGKSEALRVLIKEGKADVNKTSNKGATPCSRAIANKHNDALQVLIKEGKAVVDEAQKTE